MEQMKKKKKFSNNTLTTKLLIPLKCLVGHFYTFLGFKKKTIDLIYNNPRNNYIKINLY